MLAMDNVQKMYGDLSGPGGFHAVKDFTLRVKEGEFFTFVGPSGCGKTTALRMIAGLETPTGGTIRISDAMVYSAHDGVFVPVNQRDIAMVFQSYAIWPHMSVAENVAFPLDVVGMGRRESRAKVDEALAMVGMEGMRDRPATDLSGGQQQRVALARALIKNAKLLLLDEPLSNLDAELRVQMRRELRSLQSRLGATFIYVTHDQEEAMSISDRVAILRAGRIVEFGAPQDLYLRPSERFTATFLGLGELWDAVVVAKNGDSIVVQTDVGPVVCESVGDAEPNDRVNLLIRPEHVTISTSLADTVRVNRFTGTVSAVSFAGRYIDYTVECSGRAIFVQTSSLEIFDVGTSVSLHFPPNRCIILK